VAYPAYGAPVYASAPVTTTTAAASRPANDAAKLVVDLPADAKLFIDDQQMKTTSERRVFNTPKLEAGTSYYYQLRAEVVRDGKTYTENKRIIVRAGETSKATFGELANAGQAAKTEATAAR
jgi:uncharacterized protein (TIGR03000 family)